MEKRRQPSGTKRLLFLFFVASLVSSALSQLRQTEIEALVAFRLALSDPLAVLSGWNATAPGAPCNWRGVLCANDTGSSVVQLGLPRLRLSGPISASLSSLTSLRKLSLRSNSLTGTIPDALFSIPALRSVFLQHNALSGGLPSSSFSSSIRVLNLADNRLSGPLPSSFPADLRYLDLSSNEFSDDIPHTMLSSSPTLQSLNLAFNRLTGTIPPSVGHLQLLRYLLLDRNLLRGPIPAALTNCSSLLHLSLQGNGLSGVFPPAVGAIPTLQVLVLAHNNFTGSISSSMFYNQSALAHPPALRMVQMGSNQFTELLPPHIEFVGPGLPSALQVLDLNNNAISGAFPDWLTNLSTLKVLDLSGNRIGGSLPAAIGRLQALQELRLGKNSFGGSVPKEIGGCASLQMLDLEDNLFSGDIPATVGELRALRNLWLGGNLFTGRVPVSLGNLSGLHTLSLARNNLTGALSEELLQMSNLTYLDLSGNRFTGAVPDAIGNLVGLETLNLSGNSFTGGIPVAVGSLSSLKVLDVSGMSLSGKLPTELFGLPILQEVSLADNMFSDRVPVGFSSLSALSRLNLSYNGFSGPIPDTYGYLRSLSVLSLAYNNISGGIPASLADDSNLTVLELRSNELSGNIPGELSRLSDLQVLDLGRNELSGRFPPEIAAKNSNIGILLLDGNRLTGGVPSKVSAMSKLRVLDLSSNSLTGSIPAELGRMPGLVYLNLSHNHLDGDIPSTLGSRFADPSLFSGNGGLCGEPLDGKCKGKSGRRKKEKLILLVGIAVGTIAILALLCGCFLLSLVRWRRRFMGGSSGLKKHSPGRRSGSADSGNGSGPGENGGPKLVMFESKITYAETLEATRSFDEENVLSRGRHGLVFKACYNDGTVLSILRLASTSADGAIVIEEAPFRKEAESLGKIKHRNVTVLRGYYAGPPPDVRLLVYDYMPNGNLATLLQEASHQDGHVLNWPMRHLIALGVARGLAFLHASSIVHGDVKPQTILFDADFEGHVSDFGLDQMAVTAVAAAQQQGAGASTSTPPGSLGYVSPEVALAGQPSKEGDVYSFGIVLLELLTGKRPVMFAGEDEDIVKWVKRQLQRGQISELLEPGLLELDPESSEWEEFLLGVKVGLLCTTPGPADRPPMADVVFMLEGCRVGPADIPSSADPTSQPSPA